MGLGLGLKRSASTAMGVLEARRTVPPTIGSGTSACGSAFRAATPVTIAVQGEAQTCE